MIGFFDSNLKQQNLQTRKNRFITRLISRLFCWVSFGLYMRVLTYFLPMFRNCHQRCSIKKTVFENVGIFTGKYPCYSLPSVTLLKETIQQVLSC